SGYEEAAGLSIVGDSVQDGAFAAQFALVDDSFQIDSAQNLAGTGRDAHDFVRLPDIGIDLAANVFEFVQVIDRPAGLVGDAQAPGHAKRFGIEKAQKRSAIAQDQLGVVVRQAPAFAFA